jgi:hypothetical protein
MRILRSIALLALVGLVANCGGGGGDGGGPEEGVLILTLNTPNTGDGAILFRVNGGPVDSVQGSAMLEDGSYNTVGNQTRIVIAGPITDGQLAYLFVPDVADATDYVVTVEQVAQNASPYTQRSAATYAIAVSVAP